jgi:hypothetical protein
MGGGILWKAPESCLRWDEIYREKVLFPLRYNNWKELNVNFKKRLPSFNQLIPVYAVIVSVVYTWSLLKFFWRLPSFLYSFTAGEIVVTYAYLNVVNLFESLVILLVPIALSFILPDKWFHDRFTSKSVLLVSLLLGYLVYLASHIIVEQPFPYTLMKSSPLFVVLILVLVFFLDRIPPLSKIVESLSSRLVVFLYISIPVSLISLLIVLFRNIL